MLPVLFIQCLAHLLTCLELLSLHWTPWPPSSVALGVALDRTRSKPELLLEKALLRQPRVKLRVQRHVQKPRLRRRDRLSLLLLARRLPFWKQALGILKPDTWLPGTVRDLGFSGASSVVPAEVARVFPQSGVLAENLIRLHNRC